jgi:uncharacterized protein (DUF1786 family)
VIQQLKKERVRILNASVGSVKNIQEKEYYKMSQQNLISVSIPDTDLSEIKGAITTLNTKLMPYLKTLSVQDRQEMAKMGDKTVAFVQKALEYG